MTTPDPTLFAHLPAITVPSGWCRKLVKTPIPGAHHFERSDGFLAIVIDLDLPFSNHTRERCRRVGLSHMVFWPEAGDLLPLIEHFLGQRAFTTSSEYLPSGRPPTRAPMGPPMPAPSPHMLTASHDLEGAAIPRLPGEPEPPTTWEASVTELRAHVDALHAPVLMINPGHVDALCVSVPPPPGWERRRLDCNTVYRSHRNLRVTMTEHVVRGVLHRTFSVSHEKRALVTEAEALLVAEAFDAGRYTGFRTFVHENPGFNFRLRYGTYALPGVAPGPRVPSNGWAPEVFLRPAGRA